MTYILFIFITTFGGGYPSVTSQEFDSVQACANAAIMIHHDFNALATAEPKTVCVPKDMK